MNFLTFGDLESWLPARPFFGVVGHPVAHSLSPPMQQAALDALGVEADYLAFDLTVDELPLALPLLKKKGVKGLNLTVPHKEAVIPLLNRVSKAVSRAGSANTLTLTEEGWHGHTTDGPGFARAVKEEFFLDLRGLRVLVLGAGGAGRAVAVQCVLDGADEVHVANRTLARAQSVVNFLRSLWHTERLLGPSDPLRAHPLSIDGLQVVLDHVDLIVNCTSLGLGPGDESPLPVQLLQPHHLVFDTIYRPAKTPLLRAAAQAGARGVNGLSMLLHQGALSIESWLGVEAPLGIMREALRKASGSV